MKIRSQSIFWEMLPMVRLSSQFLFSLTQFSDDQGDPAVCLAVQHILRRAVFVEDVGSVIHAGVAS